MHRMRMGKKFCSVSTASKSNTGINNATG